MLAIKGKNETKNINQNFIISNDPLTSNKALDKPPLPKKSSTKIK